VSGTQNEFRVLSELAPVGNTESFRSAEGAAQASEYGRAAAQDAKLLERDALTCSKVVQVTDQAIWNWPDMQANEVHFYFPAGREPVKVGTCRDCAQVGGSHS